MRYGFTGTKEPLTDAQKAIINTALLSVADGTEFTTGACKGVDTYIGLTAVKLYPLPKHRVIVPADRKHVDYWWITHAEWIFAEGIDIDIIYMPFGSTYRQRNERIVDFTDLLLVFAGFPETDGRSKRSGTWMTKRIAEKRGVRIHNPYIFSDLCTSSFSGGNVAPVTEMNDA